MTVLWDSLTARHPASQRSTVHACGCLICVRCLQAGRSTHAQHWALPALAVACHAAAKQPGQQHGQRGGFNSGVGSVDDSICYLHRRHGRDMVPGSILHMLLHPGLAVFGCAPGCAAWLRSPQHCGPVCWHAVLRSSVPGGLHSWTTACLANAKGVTLCRRYVVGTLRLAGERRSGSLEAHAPQSYELCGCCVVEGRAV